MRSYKFKKKLLPKSLPVHYDTWSILDIRDNIIAISDIHKYMNDINNFLLNRDGRSVYYMKSQDKFIRTYLTLNTYPNGKYTLFTKAIWFERFSKI